MDRHPDQKKRPRSELTRDHMGAQIDKKMAYLDRVVGDVLGRSKGANGIDGLLDNCMSFLDDLSDGIADGDERQHTGLRIWRLEAGESPTKEMQTQPQVAESPAADSPAADSPAADSPAADSQDDQKVAATQYFIRRKKKVLGPVSADEIKQNIASGNLKDSDQISKKKDGPWDSVKKIPAFSSLFKS